MLKKWMLSAVAGLTLLTPLAAVSAVQAKGPEAPREVHRHERERDRDHDRDHDRGRERFYGHFDVFYRKCCDAPWASYGCFDSYRDACNAQAFLRGQGYEVSFR